jgi:hypothetical protein
MGDGQNEKAETGTVGKRGERNQQKTAVNAATAV